jgi:hypothetical protein
MNSAVSTLIWIALIPPVILCAALALQHLETHLLPPRRAAHPTALPAEEPNPIHTANPLTNTDIASPIARTTPQAGPSSKEGAGCLAVSSTIKKGRAVTRIEIGQDRYHPNPVGY